MPKFYSKKAFQEMVAQYVANGFSTSAAEEIVLAEEAIAMQEFDQFRADVDEQDNDNDTDAESWIDTVDSTSYHTGDVDN